MESARFLVGQFLLAMPGIGDPRFEQAVIAMCGHDEAGAIGIGIGATIDGLGLHDVLGAIAEAKGPSRWIVALGYAGWGAGQLDGEMLRHGWFNVAGDEALIYDTPAAARWATGFASAGIAPRLLVPETGTAYAATPRPLRGISTSAPCPP